jgi:thiamine kinase-like enzyme
MARSRAENAAMTSPLEDRVRALPCWKGPVSLERLSGGVSNVSFLVTDGGAKFVARLGGDIPAHHVSRERELIASRAAHAAGFSPKVVHTEPGVMVFDFIPSRTYSEANVRTNSDICVAFIKRIHKELGKLIQGPPAIFWVFHVLRDYFARLESTGHPQARHAGGWRKLVDAMENVQLPMPIVFGHHDLLPTNFLDDGKRLWLIDWEYGAFGTPMFDLANLAANNSFARSDEQSLLANYFERAPDEALWRSFDAMKVASALREAVWGMISELFVKAPGIDYVAYAREYLGRFDTVLAAYETNYGKLR